mgnify:FL=1|jgi:GMP reductase
MINMNDKKLQFDDILISPKLSNINSRKEVILDTAIKFPNSGILWEGIPIMASNMDFVGTFEMGHSLQDFNITTAISKFYSPSDWVDAVNNGLDLDFNFMTFGLDNLNKIYEYFSFMDNKISQIPKCIVFDVPNGYIDSFHSLISDTRNEFPGLGIMAGNVVTPDGVARILDSGGDGVKVGIGSGSVCSTTNVTGIGYPQMSAILECAEEADKFSGFIISDGGVRSSADVVKAYAGGSGFVMVGSLLSGHAQGLAPIISKDDKSFRQLYGMSSSEAMQKHYGGVAEYRASEGVSVLVEDKGDVRNTISQVLGGLRSACTYINAKNIGEISENARLIRV